MPIPITIVVAANTETENWVKTFLHDYGRTPNIWALHNYNDVNFDNNKGVVWFMRLFHPKTVWITETGAWNYFDEYGFKTFFEQTKEEH